MKRVLSILVLLVSMALLCGCSEETVSSTADAAISAAEKIVTTVIESIDWEELQDYAQQGYDALIEKYPALSGENIKSFLTENGLKLMSKYLSSTDEQVQENARKLGQILKILNPELSDEVDKVISPE